jgi:hypothetical protein
MQGSDRFPSEVKVPNLCIYWQCKIIILKKLLLRNFFNYYQGWQATISKAHVYCITLSADATYVC